MSKRQSPKANKSLKYIRSSRSQSDTDRENVRERVDNILGGEQGDIFLEDSEIEVQCSATEISYVDKMQNPKAIPQFKASKSIIGNQGIYYRF